MREVLAYVAAGLVALWGVAHAVPTRQVVAGFGAITVDNRRVLLQEWLAEAFTMWGLAAAIVAATVNGAGNGTIALLIVPLVGAAIGALRGHLLTPPLAAGAAVRPDGA